MSSGNDKMYVEPPDADEGVETDSFCNCAPYFCTCITLEQQSANPIDVIGPRISMHGSAEDTSTAAPKTGSMIEPGFDVPVD